MTPPINALRLAFASRAMPVLHAIPAMSSAKTDNEVISALAPAEEALADMLALIRAMRCVGE